MPRFLTVSPTHVNGKKPYSWEKFLEGNYIALGWYHTDFTGWTSARIFKDIKRNHFDNETEAIDAHSKFFELEVGDIVAPNNVNHGLFGIGIVKSDYKFKKCIHDTGSNNREDFYSHYREVEWLIDHYQKREDLLAPGETCWEVRGTIGMLNKTPDYIKRLFECERINLAPTSVDWEGDSELIGFEGKTREELKLHKWIERDSTFVQAYKKKYAGVTNCQGCGLHPKSKFGIEAVKFLELHHIYPLALRKSDRNTITGEKDVASLCPNCHKLIHSMMSSSAKEMIELDKLRKRVYQENR